LAPNGAACADDPVVPGDRLATADETTLVSLLTYGLEATPPARGAL
jgi:hypothetical protein